MISELEERVSFEVLQDTDEADVWNKLEGGKDDVYIYDKCGKLAYYIPYPLSVMTTSDPLVPKAVIATYFGSPCSNSCEANATFSTTGYNESIETTTQFNIVTTLMNQDNLNKSDSENATTSLEQNPHMHHHVHNNESHLESLNETNNVFHLIMHANDVNATDQEINSIIDTTTNDIINYNSTDTSDSSDPTAANGHHMSNELVKRELNNGSRKSDRCKEADLVVCRDFSKKRLLKVQTCCMLGNNQRTQSCKLFTRRKCKKLKMVIKCCIKTSISDETTTVPSTGEPVGTICCTDTVYGQNCRTSDTGECNPGEYEDVGNFADENTITNNDI